MAEISQNLQQRLAMHEKDNENAMAESRVARLSSKPKKPITAIVDNLNTAVVVLDSDLSVVSLNNAAESLLHVSANSVLGKPLTKFLLKAEDLIVALRRSLRESQAFTARSTQLRLPENMVEQVDLTASQLEDGHGLVLEMHPTSRISLISKSNDSEAQQLTTRSLVRGLAHEVKNPLGGIRGAAQLLEKALPNDDLREYTAIIISEADRLRDLVDRMLGPWQPLLTKPINSLEIADRVVQVLQAEYKDKINWERDYDPSLPFIEGCQDQLIQAILNIVRNACEAVVGMAKPRITLQTRVERQFTIGTKRHRQILRLDVTDNGPGIDTGLIDRIFFPMISGRPNGSGLGLSISQNIIGQHSGTIQVVSRPGNTVFSIFLPFATEIAS